MLDVKCPNSADSFSTLDNIMHGIESVYLLRYIKNIIFGSLEKFVGNLMD